MWLLERDGDSCNGVLEPSFDWRIIHLKSLYLSFGSNQMIQLMVKKKKENGLSGIFKS